MVKQCDNIVDCDKIPITIDKDISSVNTILYKY